MLEILPQSGHEGDIITRGRESQKVSKYQGSKRYHINLRPIIRPEVNKQAVGKHVRDWKRNGLTFELLPSDSSMDAKPNLELEYQLRAHVSSA